MEIETIKITYGSFVIPVAYWLGLDTYLPGGNFKWYGFGILFFIFIVIGSMISINNKIGMKVIIALAAPMAVFLDLCSNEKNI